ncbi:MAG: diguanylate cyclase, partial [Gammaproteobacteria bacterium]|nr:diguanylate cyclase [Gammaproteobacteria bacterium]
DNYNDKYEPFLCAPIDKDTPIIEWVFTFSSAGSERLITGSGTNIEFEEDVQHKLHLAERLFEESSNALIITDQNLIITDVNNAFEKNTGYSREEALGKTPRLFKSNQHDKTFYTAMWNDITEKGCWTGELWNKRKSGEIHPLLASISAIKKHDGTVTHYLCNHHDITEKKKHEEQLEKLAHNDPLTGLPNRRYLNKHIEKLVLQSERDNSKMAILYIDLDGFKKVNDEISHQAGDIVLKNLAAKFQNLIRKNEFIARLGGDEFCMVISSFTDKCQLENTARRLIDECTETMSIEGMDIEIGMSIGIAIYPDNGKTYQELISKADTAMYFVKDNAKGSYAFVK